VSGVPDRNNNKANMEDIAAGCEQRVFNDIPVQRQHPAENSGKCVFQVEMLIHDPVFFSGHDQEHEDLKNTPYEKYQKSDPE
jgi:hypothetical protein